MSTEIERITLALEAHERPAGVAADDDTATASLPELHLVMVDVQGRLALRRPIACMGWQRKACLGLMTSGNSLQLFDTATTPANGIEVDLDGRCRLQLPYGIRSMTGLRPGVRAAMLAMPQTGHLVALPLSRLVAILVGGR